MCIFFWVWKEKVMNNESQLDNIHNNWGGKSLKSIVYSSNM